MPDISLACEEAERKGIQIGERKDRDASDLIIAMIAGRMRMVCERLRALGDPVLVELAQELEDVLPDREEPSA